MSKSRAITLGYVRTTTRARPIQRKTVAYLVRSNLSATSKFHNSNARSADWYYQKNSIIGLEVGIMVAKDFYPFDKNR